MSSCLRSSSPLDSLALSVCPGITAFTGATAEPLFSCASNTDMMSSWLLAPELILSLLAVSKPGSKLPVGLEFWSAKMIVCQMPSFLHYGLTQTSVRAFKPHTAATWYYVAYKEKCWYKTGRHHFSPHKISHNYSAKISSSSFIYSSGIYSSVTIVIMLHGR